MTIEKWIGNFNAQYGGCRNKYPSFQVKQQVRALKLKDATKNTQKRSQKYNFNQKLWNLTLNTQNIMLLRSIHNAKLS